MLAFPSIVKVVLFKVLPNTFRNYSQKTKDVMVESNIHATPIPSPNVNFAYPMDKPMDLVGHTHFYIHTYMCIYIYIRVAISARFCVAYMADLG